MTSSNGVSIERDALGYQALEMYVFTLVTRFKTTHRKNSNELFIYDSPAQKYIAYVN